MCRLIKIVFCLLLVSRVEAVRLTVLTFNDIYHIEPIEGWGGVAELAGLLERERAKSPHSITTVNGDFLFPSLLSTVTKGAQMVDLFNQIGVDYVVFGNHEFDEGPTVLQERIDESKFVWLGSNVESKLAGYQDVALMEVDGIKVGLFGVCLPETAQLSNPGPTIEFEPVIPTAKRMCAELQARGAEVIIALTHQTIEADMALTAAVEEIDLVLGGHEHMPITVQWKETLIQKSGHDGHYLCRLDIDLERSDEGVKLRPQWQMIANYGRNPQPEVAKQVAFWNEKCAGALSRVVTTLDVDLDAREESLWKGDSSAGALVAKFMAGDKQAEIGLVNAGLIRSNKVYSQGSQLTEGDILEMLPYPNVLVKIRLSGKALKRAIEEGKKRGHTAYPQVFGGPIEEDKTYTVATTNYLYRGGDGYSALSQGLLLSDPAQERTIAHNFSKWLKQ